MTEQLAKAKEILIQEKHACVVVSNEKTITSDQSGIKILLDWLNENKDVFLNTSVADKIIGGAAASVMIYGGIKEAYAEIISDSAIKLFTDNKIPFFFDKKVEYIKNRDKTDMCPMEKTCLGIDSPEEAYIALRKKIFGE
ncbi:MAG: DUF1893 domain-containing protein [Bacillota bacterium]|nr:DUF1893 domain-containing protein [Bacillota bacterium]